MMALGTLVVAAWIQQAAADVSVGVGLGVNLTFDTCRSELEPYGAWQTTAELGDVWVPAGMPAAWHPYSYGHWLYTDCGWYWESDYSWGWLPFHYGRWSRHPSLGWCWVPGYVWAPAWVTWYYTDAYVGWAPVAVYGACVSYSVAPCDWFFVSLGCFTAGSLWTFSVSPWCVGPTVCSSYTVINNYYCFNNYYYYDARRCDWYGPPLRVIERHAGRKLSPYTLSTAADRTRHGTRSDRKLEVYRPTAERKLVTREIPDRVLTRMEKEKPSLVETRKTSDKPCVIEPVRTTPRVQPAQPHIERPVVRPEPARTTPRVQPAQPHIERPVARPEPVRTAPRVQPAQPHIERPVARPEPVRTAPRVQPAQPHVEQPLAAPVRSIPAAPATIPVAGTPSGVSGGMTVEGRSR